MTACRTGLPKNDVCVFRREEVRKEIEAGERIASPSEPPLGGTIFGGHCAEVFCPVERS